jgi:ketosteroid isomerase-like protein
MSNPYVELVKRFQPSGEDLVEVFSGDVSGFVSEEDAQYFADDFEVRWISEYTTGPSEFDARGPEGLAATWQEWLTPFKSYRLELEEVIDAVDNVVVFVRVEARTERDNVLVQHAPAAIWRFNDEGRIVAIHFYLDRAEALEAAGLPSEEFAQKTE